MILRTLESKRMTLVAATVPLIEADLQGCNQLAGAINARVPDNWPPDLYERPAMEYALQQLQDPAEQGWSFWYLLTRLPQEVEVFGICGFKGDRMIPDPLKLLILSLASFAARVMLPKRSSGWFYGRSAIRMSIR